LRGHTLIISTSPPCVYRALDMLLKEETAAEMTNPPPITPPPPSITPPPPPSISSAGTPSPGREGGREGLSFKVWDDLCRMFEGVLSLEALHRAYGEAEGLEGAVKVKGGRREGGREGGRGGARVGKEAADNITHAWIYLCTTGGGADAAARGRGRR